MPSLDFKAIKLEVPLQHVLDHIGWRAVSSKGGQRRGPCPIHRSASQRSRSFAVLDEFWFCHKCKIGGDQLFLWSLLKDLPLYDATINLCRTLGRPIFYMQRPLYTRMGRNREEER